MARKRKRVPDDEPLCPRKRSNAITLGNDLHRTVLNLHYPEVVTLRNYLLTRLPSTSRVRKHAIRAFGLADKTCILDSCLVGVTSDPSPALRESRARDLVAFSQSQALIAERRTGKGQTSSIHEIVDFAVWLLFNKGGIASNNLRHLLCSGMQRSAVTLGHDVLAVQKLYLPGIVQLHRNERLERLKQTPWLEILPLLGADGDIILSGLLVDCGLFTRLDNGAANYFQLSGIPISDLPARLRTGKSSRHAEPSFTPRQTSRRPTEICLVRSRIFYAKPSLNRASQIQFGLKHAHVLERYSNSNCLADSIHVLKYVFPRQFKLHNVFTSHVDSRETSQPLLDYTYREQEIGCSKKTSHIPRRLRRGPTCLVQKLQRRHSKCSYSQLLEHYCPIQRTTTGPSRNPPGHHGYAPLPPAPLLTQGPSLSFSIPLGSTDAAQHEVTHSFLPYSTSSDNVSAFCRSVIHHLLPADTLGTGEDGKHNWRNLLGNIDRFVKLRRFETQTLHNVCQQLRVKPISWLRPPNMSSTAKLSWCEYETRLGLLHELVYYIFDSLLIPVIRSNFYVTDSGPHRNQVFYFRHDIWRKISEPTLASIRINVYQKLTPSQVRHVLGARSLGYSQIRLLPKDHGSRTITNLKRRMVKIRGGHSILGPSINSQLNPIFSVLNYERFQDSARLGGAIFSIEGLRDQIKRFHSIANRSEKKYFVKVDIKSCFDTIPQEGLLQLVEELLQYPQYTTSKYAQFTFGHPGGPNTDPHVRRKFAGIAKPATEDAVFTESIANEMAKHKKGNIFTETGKQKVWASRQLMNLLREHVQNNIVKIGKNHFRQKTGIPQGSILSTLLCSFFYASFESERLGFLDSASSLLVRLIDDFLLITTEKSSAQRFLEVMSVPHAKYGIGIHDDKSLVNFDITIKGRKMPRCHGSRKFPYCGMLIDMCNLEITKDRQKKELVVGNTITVDSTRKTGSTLARKVLAFLKLQMRTMLLDFSLNSKETVMATLMQNFSETAMKLHRYLRSLPSSKRPTDRFLVGVLGELITSATGICGGRQANRHNDITRSQMCWLASVAFEQVLSPKQSQYQGVLAWLASLKAGSQSSLGISRGGLEQLVEQNKRVFEGYVY